MREYLKVTSRNLQLAINTKAFFIARKAIWFTHKADSYRIKAQLGQFVSVNRINKKGKISKRRELNLVKGTQHDAPLAALIINARRGKAGQPGLYGKKMTGAIKEMLAARARSVAFLKAGWLPAVKILAPHADAKGQPPVDKGAKQIGRPKGTGSPARAVIKMVAKIVNHATTRRDTNGALLKWGARGLDRAFQDETRSIMQYLEDKIRKPTAQTNSKL